MTKFFNKFKKPCFWPIFDVKTIFPENPAVTHNFIWVSSTMLKFRKELIIQFQENAETGKGRKDRQKDIRKDDRPDFKGPFQLLPWVQQYTIQNNIVHRGIDLPTPIRKHHPLFLAKRPPPTPHVKTVQTAPFQAIPPIY